MSTFADRGCRVVSAADPYGRNVGFLDTSRYFFFQVAPHLYYEAERILFQTRYFSENLVAPGIEPGPLDLYSGTLTTEAFTVVQLLRKNFHCIHEFP
jgi:hypothetical protein